jgi:hypothetical protein
MRQTIQSHVQLRENFADSKATFIAADGNWTARLDPRDKRGLFVLHAPNVPVRMQPCSLASYLFRLTKLL